jgi:hypothetical protein
MSRVSRVVAATCALIAFGACADPTGPHVPAQPTEAARPKLKPSAGTDPSLIICDWVNPFIYICIEVPGLSAPPPLTVPPK